MHARAQVVVHDHRSVSYRELIQGVWNKQITQSDPAKRQSAFLLAYPNVVDT